MTCCALALVLCNFIPAENRHHPERHIKNQEPASTTVSTKLRASSRIQPILRQRSITIHTKFRFQRQSPPPCHPRASAPILRIPQPSHSFQICWPQPRQRGPSWPVPSDRRRRLGPSPSCPRPPAGHFLRPSLTARASTSSSSSAPSWDSSTPSTSASTSGPSGRCRPSPRPSRSRWVAAPSVRSCFCFVVVDGMDVMACRIMPDTTTCTWSGMFQRPRAFGMRLPVWLTCILHSTHVV